MCKFLGKDLYFTVMKEHPVNGVSFCFDYNFEHEEKRIEFNYFDFILVHEVPSKAV